jgi:hypothetical protein
MKSLNYSKPLILLVILTAFFIHACKKDSSVIPKTSIEGEWKGSHTWNGIAGSFNFSIIINADGSCIPTNGDNKQGTGTWKLTDNTFEATCNYGFPAQYIYTDQFDSSAGNLINGTWSAGSEGGGWSATKVK